jgi:hypothetical protein
MNSYHGERIDCVRAYKSLYITSIDVILILIIYKAYNQYKWINIYETNYIQSKHVRKNPPLNGNKNLIVLRRYILYSNNSD